MFSQYSAIHAVPSAWSMLPAAGQRRAAVEHPDVVQAEEPALEDVAVVRVLAVQPPAEVPHQLLEGVLQEGAVRLCRSVAFSSW